MAERTIAERLYQAALIAGAAFLTATPYMYYVTKVAFPDRVREAFRAVPPEQILEVDLISVALVVAISAVVGSIFSRRYGLAGAGDLASLRASARWISIAGPILMAATYLLFGRPLAERVPGYYPESFAWAAAMVLKGAVFDEVVARFGMMTIASGVARRPWVANVMQAMFFTAVGIKSMSFFGLSLEASFFIVAGLAASFSLHLVQGWVYARYGLLSAVALHLVVELKYLLHAALV